MALELSQTEQETRTVRTIIIGTIERGVPQAYLRAHVSSATLCAVHVLRVFLCIFFKSKRESDTYQNRLGYIPHS